MLLKLSTLCRIVRLNSLFKCAKKTYIVNIDLSAYLNEYLEGG